MPKKASMRIWKVRGKEPFSVVITNTNNCISQSLGPGAFSDRLKNLGFGFEFFRFTRLKWVIPPISRWETSLSSGFNNTAQSAAVAYLPEVPVSTVSTLTPTNLLSLEASKPIQLNLGIEGAAASFVMSLPGNTTTQTLVVPRSVLLAVPGKWYRNNAITEDLLAVQGTFLFSVADAAGANTVVLNGQMEYEIEFSGQANTAVI